MSRYLKEGKQWRLGWNPDATVFKGLIGGSNWALELTETEFKDFCRLALELANMLQDIASELMDEEQIMCEQATDYIWMAVEGVPDCYSLQVILLTGRRGEGSWSPAAVTELLPTIPALMLM